MAVGTHLVAIVHNHQVPQAQGPEKLEDPWQRRLLQGTSGTNGSQRPQLALVPQCCQFPDRLGRRGAPKCYLRHGVGRGVHELAQVDHALALVLGDVDRLDGGEAGVGVPEILQLQPPLHQAQVGPLHKNLGGRETISDHPKTLTGALQPHCPHQGTKAGSRGKRRGAQPLRSTTHLVLQQDDELGAQDQTPQPGHLQQSMGCQTQLGTGGGCKGPTLWAALAQPTLDTSPFPPAGAQPTWVLLGLLSTTGKPLWLEEVSLRMSTTVPTRSILRRQVTGVLMTSLRGRVGGETIQWQHASNSPHHAHNTSLLPP